MERINTSHPETFFKKISSVSPRPLRTALTALFLTTTAVALYGATVTNADSSPLFDGGGNGQVSDIGQCIVNREYYEQVGDTPGNFALILQHGGVYDPGGPGTDASGCRYLYDVVRLVQFNPPDFPSYDLGPANIGAPIRDCSDSISSGHTYGVWTPEGVVEGPCVMEAKAPVSPTLETCKGPMSYDFLVSQLEGANYPGPYSIKSVNDMIAAFDRAACPSTLAVETVCTPSKDTQQRSFLRSLLVSSGMVTGPDGIWVAIKDESTGVEVPVTHVLQTQHGGFEVNISEETSWVSQDGRTETVRLKTGQPFDIEALAGSSALPDPINQASLKASVLVTPSACP